MFLKGARGPCRFHVWRASHTVPALSSHRPSTVQERYFFKRKLGDVRKRDWVTVDQKNDTFFCSWNLLTSN